MLTFIGKFKELCSKHPEYPSILSSVSSTPYPGQGEIIHYLRKGGSEDMVSAAIRKDVISGKSIPGSDVGRNDGEFTWWTSLAYYVEHYNLKLPREFENKILGIKT